MDEFLELENFIGIKFHNQEVLKLAFIHRSFLNEIKGRKLISNERLEFLGDAILSFVVSCSLYQEYPELPEGDLTNYRSSLVCARSLSQVAAKLALGKYLKMSKGENKAGGTDNPSLLANTVESLIGAIYLDTGLPAAQKFIQKFILPSLSEIIKNKSFKDYKSLFQEKIQERIKISPIYKVLESWGPDHDKSFKIGVYIKNKLVAQGIGKSKQEAEQLAAQSGIEKWEEIR